MFVFVSARKSPIVPKPIYQAVNCEPSYSQGQFLKNNSKKKPGPFDIDSLIGNNNAEKINLKNCHLKIDDCESSIISVDNADDLSSKIEFFDANSMKDASNSITLYPGVTIEMTKVNKEDKEKSENMCISKAVTDNLTNYSINYTTTNYNYINNACTYRDRSAEVKHAQTPIYTNSHQTHSPQLPIPSPNYPVQTTLSTDYTCMNPTCAIEVVNKLKKLNLNEAANKPNLISSNLHFKSVSIIQVPNIKRIKQNKSFRNLHLPPSNENQKSSNDITIENILGDNSDKYNTDLISNNGNFSESKEIVNELKECVILNIPNVNNHQPPPTKKPKLSKMDISVQKRKRRKEKRQLEGSSSNKENEKRCRNRKEERVVYERITTHKGTVTNYGVHVYGYSDSSSSSSYTSSESESDTGEMEDFENINATHNKFNLTPEKVKFFQFFGLATQKKKNEIEFSKIERRKWRSRLVQPSTKEPEIKSLNLPVPSDSPSVLNTTPDYNLKSSFFHTLGLTSLPPSDSEEYEKIWLRIVKDRMKRKCVSAVTKYSLKVCAYNKQKFKIGKSSTQDKIENSTTEAQYNRNHQVMAENKRCFEELSKNGEDNSLLDRNCDDSSINVVKYFSISNEPLKKVGKSDILRFPHNICVNFTSTTDKVNSQLKKNGLGIQNDPKKTLRIPLPPKTMTKETLENYKTVNNEEETKASIETLRIPKIIFKDALENWKARNSANENFTPLKIITNEVLENWKAGTENFPSSKIIVKEVLQEYQKGSSKNGYFSPLKVITDEVLQDWKTRNDEEFPKSNQILQICKTENSSNEILQTLKREEFIHEEFRTTKIANEVLEIYRTRNVDEVLKHCEAEEFITESFATPKEGVLQICKTGNEILLTPNIKHKSGNLKHEEFPTPKITNKVLQISRTENLENENFFKPNVVPIQVLQNWSIENVKNEVFSTPQIVDEVLQICGTENDENENLAIQKIIVNKNVQKCETTNVENEKIVCNQVLQDCKRRNSDNDKNATFKVKSNKVVKHWKVKIIEKEKFSKPKVNGVLQNLKTENVEKEKISKAQVVTSEILQNLEAGSVENVKSSTVQILSNVVLQNWKEGSIENETILTKMENSRNEEFEISPAPTREVLQNFEENEKCFTFGVTSNEILEDCIADEIDPHKNPKTALSTPSVITNTVLQNCVPINVEPARFSPEISIKKTVENCQDGKAKNEISTSSVIMKKTSQNCKTRNDEIEKVSMPTATNKEISYGANEDLSTPTVLQHCKTMKNESERCSTPTVISNPISQSSKTIEGANKRILIPVIVTNTASQKNKTRKENKDWNDDVNVNHNENDNLLKAQNDIAVIKKEYRTIYTQTLQNADSPYATMILLDNCSLQKDNEFLCTTKEIKGKELELKRKVVNKKIQCSIKEDVIDKKVQCTMYTMVDTSGFKCLKVVDNEVQQWTGMHQIMELSQSYIKECDSKIEILTKELTNLKGSTLLKQTESKYLERKLLTLQSASYLFEKERTQFKKAIDHLTKIINAFR